jgi:gamma-F420-2:alpha-L-glutamate ligase
LFFSSNKHTHARYTATLTLHVLCFIFQANKFELVVSNNGIDGFVYDGQEVAVPDAVMVRLGAEIDYFGLAVLRQLEIMDVRIFNSVNAMEISRDKMYTHQVLSRNGFNIPRSFLAVLPTDFKTVVQTVGLPVIVKALSGARGDQVWKFDSNEEFQKGLDEVHKEVEGSPVVLQEFVADSTGRDLRVVVVKGEVVAGMMRVANSGFKANVHQGGRVEKIAIEKPLAAMAIKAANICNLDIAGVDLLLSEDGYKICEINSSPGFEGLEHASEINVAKAMLLSVQKTVMQDRKEARIRRRKKTLEVVPVQKEQLGSSTGGVRRRKSMKRSYSVANPAAGAADSSANKR